MIVYHLLMFSSELATYIRLEKSYTDLTINHEAGRKIITIFIKSKISKQFFKKYILHDILFILLHTSASRLLSIHPHVRTIKKKRQYLTNQNAKTHRSIKKKCIVGLDEFAYRNPIEFTLLLASWKTGKWDVPIKREREKKRVEKIRRNYTETRRIKG